VLHGIPEELRYELESYGVRVIDDGPVRRAEYPAVMGRLVRRLRRLQIDVLHTHNFHASALGMVAGRAARVPVCLVSRHHCDETDVLGKPWHRRVDQLSGRLADLTVANSRWTMSVLESKERLPPSKVRLVYYGIDLDPFLEVPPEAAAEFRQDCDLSDKFLLTVLGRLDPLKGHRFLLDAMPEVVRALGPKVRLLVVGSGPTRDACEEQVKRLGLEPYVRFLGYRCDIPRILTATDVVVIPSVTEAFGLVLVESMACGAAIVASDVGGIPEVVSDGRTGLLVPPRSPDALARAIIRLHDEPALRTNVAANGREDVTKRFQLDRMVSDYQSIYLELAARARVPRPAPFEELDRLEV